MLYSIGKQAYKLKLLKKWRIYNVFHVSLLEHDIPKKEQVKKIAKLDTGDNGEKYKIEAIWHIAVYARELEGHLPGLYYLVVWKGYPKEENI